MPASSHVLREAVTWLRARWTGPRPAARGDGGEPLVRAGLRGFLALERRDLFLVGALVTFAAVLRFASPIFPDFLTNPFGGAPIATWGIGHPYNGSECTPVPLTPSSITNTSACGFVFDEVYFPVDASKDMHEPAQSYFDPEPPLAKLLMTPPIAAMGFKTWSWRISTGVFGSLLVGLVYLTALRLRRDRWFATIAALFIAIDGLALVESRTGVIDIIAICFVALFYYVFLLHWQARTPRQWRATLYVMAAVAGLAFGAKLTALAPLAVAAALLLARGIAPLVAALIPAVRRLSGPRRHEVVMWRSAAGPWAIVHYTGAAVIAICIFSASFSRYLTIEHTDVYRFTGCNPSTPGLQEAGPPDTLQVSWNPVTDLRNIADDMAAGLQYHAHECHTHPYASRWYSWPIMEHPVLFYYDQQNAVDPSNPTVSAITDAGNPALWWLAIPALLVCAWRATRGPPLLRLAIAGLGIASLATMMIAFHAVEKPGTAAVPRTPVFLAGFAGIILFCALLALSAVISRRFVPAFIVLGYLTSWMMWVLGNFDRVLFFYHALGMLIFAALALAYALSGLRQTCFVVGNRVVSTSPLAWAGVIAVAGAFIFFYPVWTAMPLPDIDHQMRTWVDLW